MNSRATRAVFSGAFSMAHLAQRFWAFDTSGMASIS
jgi:hypothetical protein